jgi:hypothetical protein
MDTDEARKKGAVEETGLPPVSAMEDMPSGDPSDYSAFVESGSGGGAPDWHALAKTGTLPQLRAAVEAHGAEGLSVASTDMWTKLPIHIAAESGKSVEAVRYLVEQGGADTLTARDESGTLAIHYAAQYSKSAEAVRYLAEQGGAATLTAKDVLGNLAIHLAAARDRNESVEVVRCLAEQGPSTLKVPDEQGRDALTLAKSSYHKAVQQWANTHGCELGRYRVDDDQIHHRCAPNTRRRASPPRCFPHACFFASMHARTC